MAKTVDITDKLSFDENPRLVVKGREIEVNADASTMLQVMGVFRDKGELEGSMELCGLVFNEEGRKAIEELDLSFKDLQIVLETAVGLIMGEEEAPGEEPTRATT